MSERNLIIHAGQITRGKGVEVLLESLAHVQVRFERLVFADGRYREFCERLGHRLGLAGKVQFENLFGRMIAGVPPLPAA